VVIWGVLEEIDRVEGFKIEGENSSGEKFSQKKFY